MLQYAVYHHRSYPNSIINNKDLILIAVAANKYFNSDFFYVSSRFVCLYDFNQIRVFYKYSVWIVNWDLQNFNLVNLASSVNLVNSGFNIGVPVTSGCFLIAFMGFTSCCYFVVILALVNCWCCWWNIVNRQELFIISVDDNLTIAIVF